MSLNYFLKWVGEKLMSNFQWPNDGTRHKQKTLGRWTLLLPRVIA